MKTLLTIVFIFVCLTSYSQSLTIDSLTNNVKYEVVVEQATSKDELYNRAKLWVSQNFGDSETVIDLDDKVQGQLFIKGETFAMNRVEFEGKTLSLGMDISFDLRLYLKNNKYKVVVDNLQTKGSSDSYTLIDATRLHAARSGKPVRFDGDAVVVSEQAVDKIVASLKTALAAKPESDF